MKVVLGPLVEPSTILPSTPEVCYSTWVVGKDHTNLLTELLIMENLSRELMIGMLNNGKTGNQLLEILNAIVSSTDVVEVQEQEVAV